MLRGLHVCTIRFILPVFSLPLPLFHLSLLFIFSLLLFFVRLIFFLLNDLLLLRIFYSTSSTSTLFLYLFPHQLFPPVCLRVFLLRIALPITLSTIGSTISSSLLHIRAFQSCLVNILTTNLAAVVCVCVCVCVRKI